MSSVNPVLPRLSIAEKERRYSLVRNEMIKRGLDCLIIPQNTGEWDACQADARYLSTIGGGGTAVGIVFPVEGEPIAIVREPRRIEFWVTAQDWVKDIRATKEGRWGAALVEATRSIGMENARIGVPGLSGVLRFPDGTVSSGEYEMLKTEFPNAAFVSATAFMHEIRMKKSREEIELIKKAQECADAISSAIFEHASEGINEQVLYAEMIAAHVRAGGEMPGMFLVGIGQAPNQTFLMPSNRELKINDILICEAEIKYAGYMAQSVESLCLGSPPKEYERLYQLSLECFKHILELAEPGMPYAELIRFWVKFMEDNNAIAAPTMGHGVGLGMDGPTTRPGGDGQGRVIEDGHCFILKPWAASNVSDYAIRTGNTVVMEKGSLRRLGSLPMEFRKL